jgi:hypothetical protein
VIVKTSVTAHACLRSYVHVMRTACLLVLAASLLLVPLRARACGASGGALGASACSLAEHEEEVRNKWRVGAAYAFTSTAIRFEGDTTLDETRHTVLGTIAYAPTPRWTFELGLGALASGELSRKDATFSLQPGLVSTLGGSYRLLDSEGARPFVVASLSVAYAHSRSELDDAPAPVRASYDALDFRLGGLVGWNLFRLLSTYALVRAFGGPVYWTFQGDSVVGTDTHHYQVGAGAVLRLGHNFDVYVEGVPLGEQAITAGMGLSL